MAVKARAGKVFVKADEKVKQVGSILLAEEAQSTVETGTVVSSGVEDIKVGDRVVYDKALTITYKDLLVIDDEDCWGVLEGEDK